MWDYIQSVNEEGTTIFLTTHYMDEADQLSNRVSIIDHGQIIATGPAWELKNMLGADLIFLETSDDATARDILRKMPNVTGIQEKKAGFIARVSQDGTHILPGIMDELRNSGIQIRTVNLKKPSMDDVFVHFTGRDLRDEGPEHTPAALSRALRR